MPWLHKGISTLVQRISSVSFSNAPGSCKVAPFWSILLMDHRVINHHLHNMSIWYWIGQKPEPTNSNADVSYLQCGILFVGRPWFWSIRMPQRETTLAASIHGLSTVHISRGKDLLKEWSLEQPRVLVQVIKFHQLINTLWLESIDLWSLWFESWIIQVMYCCNAIVMPTFPLLCLRWLIGWNDLCWNDFKVWTSGSPPQCQNAL